MKNLNFVWQVLLLVVTPRLPFPVLPLFFSTLRCSFVVLEYLSDDVCIKNKRRQQRICKAVYQPIFGHFFRLHP